MSDLSVMKRNVLVLASAQAMMMIGGSLIVATSALVGHQLSTDKSLATLPLALQMFAGMLTTIPASLLMQKIGRQKGFLIGTLIGTVAAALAAFAISRASFELFTVAAALTGISVGFGNYYRFAASDAANDEYRSRAISYVMAGGVIAAVIGPNLAQWTQHWSTTPFAGSFAALAGITLISFFTLLFLRIPTSSAELQGGGRPLREIAVQPVFMVAAMGGMFGYGVMALVMSATPLAMHDHQHAFSDTAFVIEWHVLGMFAPSFFTGHLIRRFGVLRVMLTGTLLSAACVMVNLSGTTIHHFWLGLTLLGLGWNFLFIGATTLLTETYSPPEKAKTQALNDFLVFSTTSIAVLFAGNLHHHYGWQAVNYGVLPVLVVTASAILWLARLRRTAPVRESA